MFVTMHETRCGSEDAFGVSIFRKDKTYQMADSLAASWVRLNVARNSTLEEVTQYMNDKIKKVG